MATTPRHSVSVAGIVIRDDDRVLVIKRDDNGHWEAPGGVLELDESFEDGVRREVLEETGLEVTVERLTGVYKNMNRGIVALVYRCRPAAGEPHPTEEVREILWMTREEVQAAMVPAFGVRVLGAFEEAPQSRTHDGINLVAVESRDVVSRGNRLIGSFKTSEQPEPDLRSGPQVPHRGHR